MKYSLALLVLGAAAILAAPVPESDYTIRSENDYTIRRDAKPYEIRSENDNAIPSDDYAIRRDAKPYEIRSEIDYTIRRDAKPYDIRSENDYTIRNAQPEDEADTIVRSTENEDYTIRK